MSYLSVLPWREKSLNFNSPLNSTTCWDKEGGAVNQLNSLGRKIIVISFFLKIDDNNKLYYFKVTHYSRLPTPHFWQLKLILKGEVVEIWREYIPDILNLNPLTKETADPEKTELCWCPVPGLTCDTHHMSLNMGDSP